MIEEFETILNDEIRKMIYVMIKMVDEELEKDHAQPLPDVHNQMSMNSLFSARTKLAMAYNELTNFDNNKINPFAYKLEKLKQKIDYHQECKIGNTYLASHKTSNMKKKAERHLIHCPMCETQNYADNKQCVFCFGDIQQYLKDHTFLTVRQYVNMGDGNIRYV